MCAKTESTRPGEGTDPFLKISTDRSSQAVCHISARKCLCRYQQALRPEFAVPSPACCAGVPVLCEFLHFCHYCLFGCLYVGGGVGVCLFLLAEHTCLKGFSPPLNSSTIPPSLVSREAETWGSCRRRRSCSDPACLLATGLFGPGPGSGSKRRNRVPERREC